MFFDYIFDVNEIECTEIAWWSNDRPVMMYDNGTPVDKQLRSICLKRTGAPNQTWLQVVVQFQLLLATVSQVPSIWATGGGANVRQVLEWFVCIIPVGG